MNEHLCEYRVTKCAKVVKKKQGKYINKKKSIEIYAEHAEHFAYYNHLINCQHIQVDRICEKLSQDHCFQDKRKHLLDSIVILQSFVGSRILNCITRIFSFRLCDGIPAGFIKYRNCIG